MELKAHFFKQHGYNLVFFSAKGSDVWSFFSINRRVEDKDEGYQRAISISRVKQISKFIDAGNLLPLSILVSLEKGKYKVNKTKSTITLEDSSDVGWIIDGQHRIAGAHGAKSEIEIPIIGILDLDLNEQIKQFVTINKEAKGVPTSLYYDLLKHLPTGTPSERAKERAVDIAKALRKDEESTFYNRIVSVRAPQRGELSLTGFTKHISSLVFEGKGILSTYGMNDQVKIFDNYYKAVKNSFPKDFNDPETVFFRTTGFGAMIRVFPAIFSLSLKLNNGFTVADVTEIFNRIQHFNFDNWKKIGTGNAAEIQAADDLRQEIEDEFSSSDGSSTINL